MDFVPTQPGIHAVEHVFWLDRESYAARGGVVEDAIGKHYSGSRDLTRIKIGRTVYPLRRSLKGRFDPLPSGGFEFVVDGFADPFVGRGETRDDAYRDWSEQIHVSFQTLLRKRPFEMDAEDKHLWSVLGALVDVPKYRRTTPITVRQVGRVRFSKRSKPQGIFWADHTKDDVTIDSMPAAYAALLPNQWFEAEVERDPITWKLGKVLSLSPISSPRPMSMEQQQKYLQGLPNSVEHPGSNVED